MEDLLAAHLRSVMAAFVGNDAATLDLGMEPAIGRQFLPGSLGKWNGRLPPLIQALAGTAKVLVKSHGGLTERSSA